MYFETSTLLGSEHLPFLWWQDHWVGGIREEALSGRSVSVRGRNNQTWRAGLGSCCWKTSDAGDAEGLVAVWRLPCQLVYDPVIESVAYKGRLLKLIIPKGHSFCRKSIFLMQHGTIRESSEGRFSGHWILLSPEPVALLFHVSSLASGQRQRIF